MDEMSCPKIDGLKLGLNSNDFLRTNESDNNSTTMLPSAGIESNTSKSNWKIKKKIYNNFAANQRQKGVEND